MNTSITNDFLHLASSLQKEGYNMEQITLHLREKGANDNLLQEAIQHLKQLHILRKRSSGFVCCGIGVALLIVGCILTILQYTNGGDIKWVMYGLTTLGVVFTMKGLVDLLGW
jgi:hypothetical protein